MDNDRKERIRNLQIKNSRKLLYKKLNTVLDDIKLDDFISLNDTKKLQEKVFSIMAEMDAKNEFLIAPLDVSYEKILKDIKQYFEQKAGDKIVFFHHDALDIGAIELNIRTVLNNISYIVSESEMGVRGCRILLVSKDVKYGLCLWRGEYEIKLYKWIDCEIARI